MKLRQTDAQRNRNRNGNSNSSFKKTKKQKKKREKCDEMKLQANNVAQTCNMQHATRSLNLPFIPCSLCLSACLVIRHCTGVKSILYLVSGARALTTLGMPQAGRDFSRYRFSLLHSPPVQLATRHLRRRTSSRVVE